MASVIAALFTFGPLTAPLAIAAAWYWARGRRVIAGVFCVAIGFVWLLAYGLTPALIAYAARMLVTHRL